LSWRLHSTQGKLDMLASDCTNWRKGETIQPNFPKKQKAFLIEGTH